MLAKPRIPSSQGYLKPSWHPRVEAVAAKWSGIRDIVHIP